VKTRAQILQDIKRREVSQKLSKTKLSMPLSKGGASTIRRPSNMIPDNQSVEKFETEMRDPLSVLDSTFYNFRGEDLNFD